MFESSTIAVLVLLVAAWGLQIWLSNHQMRRFHRRTTELRRQGRYLAVGLAGNMYRRKTYVALVVDESGHVVTAEELSGWTVLATLQPIDGVAGMPLADVGAGEPPEGIAPKTWSAMDHAAGFIRKQLDKDRDGPADVPRNGDGGGSMA